MEDWDKDDDSIVIFYLDVVDDKIRSIWIISQGCLIKSSSWQSSYLDQGQNPNDWICVVKHREELL
jgi:hypothetical protein